MILCVCVVQETLANTVDKDMVLFIHFVPSLPSLTVQVPEESAPRPRSVELQPCGQVYPVLLLQEHRPLHH